jgi:predicted DNA-binding transcriptional regulator
MRLRTIPVVVSDTALLRYIQREMGVDVERVRAHIAGLVRRGAERSAVAVMTGRVRLVLRDSQQEGQPCVTVVTALPRKSRGVA